MSRKTTEIQGRKAQMLSKVYYQKPGRLHVQNVSPFKRRILSDGERFYLAQEGWDKGYSVPLSELPEAWKIMQESVPATAMEHLARLQGVDEQVLDKTQEFPVRRGYQTEHVYVVLSCDSHGRLKQIEFFKSGDRKERTALYKYEDFIDVAEDCYLAGVQRAEILMDGEIIYETRRFDNLQFNKPVDPVVFDAKEFFDDLEFVSDFSELGN